jgi:hypothetical protein
MQLTTQQIEQLRQRGLDDDAIAQIAEKKGFSVPAKALSLSKLSKGVSSVFAGEKVGQSIGTLAGYGLTALSEKTGLPVAPGGSKYGFHKAQQGETALYDTSAPTVGQTVADVALGATQVAGAKLPVKPTIAGKAGQFGTLGALSGGLHAAAAGEDASEVAKDTVVGGALGALLGATFGVVEKGLAKGTDLMNKAGQKIQYNVIKPSQADVKDGFDINTVKEFNLGGSLKDTFRKTDQTLDDLSRELNTKLKTNKTPVDMNTVYEKTAEKLGINNLENFGASGKIGDALEQLRSEIVNTVGNNGLASIPEAQVIKRASGHFGAWQFGQVTPEATASQKVYSTFYNALKESIEEASPEGVREINQKISRLIPIMNAVIRRIPVAERNSAISLTDIITLTGASIEPTTLSLTLINRLSKMGSVGSALTNVKGLGQGAVQKAEQITQNLITR